MTNTNNNELRVTTNQNSNQLDDRISMNESTMSCAHENEDEHLANLNDMIHSMSLSNEHFKHIYMDILRNFECEQLNFDLNQTEDEIAHIEDNHNVLSDLMCLMVESLCDEEPTELKPIENKPEKSLIPEAVKPNDSNQTPTLSNKTIMNVKDPELVGIEDPFELDTFMMFRAFCKLSLRSINQESSTSLANSNSPEFKNTIDIKSKILSLQLILATLQNAKQSFKQSPHMISVIRRYLCVSLSKNGVSPILEVFELSLAIFVALLADYKQHLKKQIEVFFREIIIFLLETPTSSFDHKWLVIQALTHVCANAQCVVDLYINYDCDLQSSNIFARLINVLSKKAQGRQLTDASCSLMQMRSLRLKTLECVVSILKCMVEWSNDLYVNPNNVQSNLGPENKPADSEALELAASNKIRSYDSQNSLNSSNSTGAGNRGSALMNGADLVSNSNSYDPNDFEMIKSKKEIWERGIELFNKKPKKGESILDLSFLNG